MSADFCLWDRATGKTWGPWQADPKRLRSLSGALTAALQRYFLKTSAHPVPHLLVYDQPSQVYFPRKLAGDQKDNSAPQSQRPLADKDVEAVRKVFSALSNEVAVARGNLQVIVLDHAGDEVWGGIENTSLVEEWREGNKLVPLEWISASGAQ